MGKQELTFAIFMIHALADAWGISPQRVYTILDDANIMDEYIIPCYDVLHTQGERYLVEDITEFVQERGGIIK